MTPVVVLGLLALATILFAWGSVGFVEGDGRWQRWTGFALMMTGGSGLVAACVLAVL